MEDRATEHRDPRRRVAEVARPEIAGIASFSRTPDARRRLPDFPFPKLPRVPSSLEPVTTVGFHTDIDSNQTLFAHMLDTMWMGVPGRGQGWPQRLMPGPGWGRPSKVPHGGAGHAD